MELCLQFVLQVTTLSETNAAQHELVTTQLDEMTTSLSQLTTSLGELKAALNQQTTQVCDNIFGALRFYLADCPPTRNAG